jgi:hypothetical protein
MTGVTGNTGMKGRTGLTCSNNRANKGDSMTVVRTNMITIAELAREKGLTVSYLAKLVKLHNIVTVPAVNAEGKACQALTVTEVKKLERAVPALCYIEFDSNVYITLEDMAAKMGRTQSGVLKALKRSDYEIVYCRIPEEVTRIVTREGKDPVEETEITSGKAHPCLKKSDFTKYKASNLRVNLA